MDGLVLLIQGQSTGKEEGKPQFQALATVAFDSPSKTYRFRAYNDGHYVDTELTASSNGFSWGFKSGPAQVTNTMRLTEKGQWQEFTDMSVGGNPPRRMVDMLLERP